VTLALVETAGVLAVYLGIQQLSTRPRRFAAIHEPLRFHRYRCTICYPKTACFEPRPNSLRGVAEKSLTKSCSEDPASEHTAREAPASNVHSGGRSLRRRAFQGRSPGTRSDVNELTPCNKGLQVNHAFVVRSDQSDFRDVGRTFLFAYPLLNRDGFVSTTQHQIRKTPGTDASMSP